MIEKLDSKMEFVEISILGNKKAECLDFEAGRKLNKKINELVDAVNAIQKEREAERLEIQEWIGILEAVRKSVNVHEKQIDELQMKVEPEKATISKMEKVEKPAENVPDLDIQLSWIGYLCRFWDYDEIESTYAILDDINVCCEHPYRKSNGNQYKHCEPVKPDDDIIYKGE